jgi:DNA-binding transcriptional ArsR family regulator
MPETLRRADEAGAEARACGGGEISTMTHELPDVSDAEVMGLSRVFGLLGDPTRVRILLLLCRGEQNVSQLCAALRLPQPTVSHHLGLLRRGGLLTSRRSGKSIFYALDGRLEYSEGCELRIHSAAGVRIRIER